ncbi:MAG TPA: ABC transporter ATP-binding protein [Pirellulales bacterium]|nr:ABC transporter ATP-binding protein [Pirellulales bacterium]
MSDTILRIEQLSKCYRHARGARRHATLRDRLARIVRDTVDRAAQKQACNEEADAYWALRDVSCDISRGEVFGLAGPNGSGKSTLLKLLARITEPTAGRALIRGRVGALLEVGTGFHMELTGRENVYLSGAILGMRRSQIRSNFDAIVAMSGVAQFLELPVKRYSTGMYLRLAFSVAAHLESEILLLDEVLAVGDAAFQQTCEAKIRELARLGRTILVVSHEAALLRRICDRVMRLECGQVQAIGHPERVLPAAAAAA